MTFEEIDLSEMPPTYEFSKWVDQQHYLWDAYTPTTIEADMPFNADWWKFLYWMPKIKKEFYEMTLSALDLEKATQALCIDKYGMDYWFFCKHYDFFLKRLKWMRNSGVNYVGEVKNGR